MSGQARRTRRLRGAILKGSRRSAATSTLEPMLPRSVAIATRHADALDSHWHSVSPRPHSISIGPGSEQRTENTSAKIGLWDELRNLEHEFTSNGRFYAAAAAWSARLKYRSAPTDMDFHPALWPHIRRREQLKNNEQCPS